MLVIKIRVNTKTLKKWVILSYTIFFFKEFNELISEIIVSRPELQRKDSKHNMIITRGPKKDNIYNDIQKYIYTKYKNMEEI